MPDTPSALADALRDRYRFDRELGRGGMATVYLVHDVRHGRNVALKALHAELSDSLGAERFLREISLTAQLQHPGIVPILDSGKDAGRLWYTMPHVEGESLRRQLSRVTQLGVEPAIQIACEVAVALDYAHRRGVVHRDIKPENILLSNGHALVADFGIARAAGVAGGEKLTQTGLSVGTPDYMSPEQGAGDGQVDGRSDVYALGCMLYEMLAGEPPFTGPTAQVILARHAVAPMPPLSSVRRTVPAGIERVIRMALEKVPADRFATAAEFAAALADPTLALTTEERRTRSAKARRLRWLIPVGVATVGLVAATVVALRGRGAAALDPQLTLVGRFENRTGDVTLDPLGEMATDYVARGIAGTALVGVADARSTLGVDSARAREAKSGVVGLGKSLGAGTVVLGSYYTVGDTLRFESRLVDVATGRVLEALEPATGSLGGRGAVVELLRQRVMAGYAVRFDPRFAPFESASRPPTYDAYLEFLAADALVVSDDCLKMARGECDRQKLAHLHRAIALDTGFTLALAETAVAYMLADQCGETDSIATRLRPRLGQMSSYDRAILEWAQALCRGDQRAALAAARAGRSTAPRSASWAYTVARMAMNVNEPRETLAAVRGFDPEQGWLRLRRGNFWAMVTTAYHRLGEYDNELDAALRAKRSFGGPGETSELRARAALGQTDECVRRIRAAFTIPADPKALDPPGIIVWWVGSELRLRGHPDAARQVFDHMVTWFKSLPNADQTERREDLANWLRALERWDEARLLFEQLAAEQPDNLDYQGALGVLAARRGDRATASRIDRWLLEHIPPDGRGAAGRGADETYERARIAVQLGEFDRAVGLFRQAYAMGLRYLNGPDYDIDQDTIRRYPPYQSLMAPKP